MNILWYKKFYVTNKYKTQGISGTTHVHEHPYVSLKDLGKESAFYMANMVIFAYELALTECFISVVETTVMFMSV